MVCKSNLGASFSSGMSRMMHIEYPCAISGAVRVVYAGPNNQCLVGFEKVSLVGIRSESAVWKRSHSM